MIKIYLYAVFLLLAIFVLDAVDFNKIMKKNAGFKAQILYFLICIIFSYLVTNFFVDFYTISRL